MKKRLLGTGVAVALALALGGAPAWAGTTNVWYNKDIPSFGTSRVTESQTKTYTDTRGYVTSTQVTGSYKVTARMEMLNQVDPGSWTGFVLSDGTSHYLYNTILAGETVQMRLKTNLDTPTTVTAQGSWRSN